MAPKEVNVDFVTPQNADVQPQTKIRSPDMDTDVSNGCNGIRANATLTVVFHQAASQLPLHSHQWVGTNDTAQNTSPTGTGLASLTLDIYQTTPDVDMNAAMVENTGGSQPHKNIMPCLVLNFIIALFGVFPSRN